MKKILHFLSLLLVISCNQRKESINDQISRHHIDMTKLENEITNNNILKSKRYVFLEYSRESMIGEILKIIIKDDVIYVIDSYDRLFAFDSNGNFIFKIDSQGSGPSEYVKLMDFYVTDTSIVLLDQATRRLLKYDLDGVFQNYISLGDLTALNIANIDDYCVINLKGRYNDRKHNLFYLTQDDYDVKEQYFSYDIIFEDDRKSYFFKNDLLSSSESVLYSPGFFNDIYELTPEKLIRKYHFDFGGREFRKTTDFEQLSIKAPDARTYDFRSVDYFVSFEQYFETSNSLITVFTGFNDRFFLYYNTETKKYYVKPLTQIDKNEVWFGASTIKAMYKGELVSIISPMAFMHMSTAYREQNQGEITRFKKLGVDFLRSHEYEQKNPVLMFWKVKEEV